MRNVLLVLLGFIPSLAFAGLAPVATVPEPGTLELLSIGAIAIVIAAIRSRRK